MNDIERYNFWHIELADIKNEKELAFTLTDETKKIIAESNDDSLIDDLLNGL